MLSFFHNYLLLMSLHFCIKSTIKIVVDDVVMDLVMRRTVCHGENGFRWKFTSKLDDLEFADDVAL